MEKQSYKIGEVAKLADLGIETIRFYERNGLIEEPPRRLSGYREYPKDTVVRLRFIRRAKELGFSLKEIAGLLSLRQSKSMSCGDIRKKAQTKIEDIETRINDLVRVKTALLNLAKNCQRPTSKECPIVVSLESSVSE